MKLVEYFNRHIFYGENDFRCSSDQKHFEGYSFSDCFSETFKTVCPMHAMLVCPLQVGPESAEKIFTLNKTFSSSCRECGFLYRPNTYYLAGWYGQAAMNAGTFTWPNLSI